VTTWREGFMQWRMWARAGHDLTRDDAHRLHLFYDALAVHWCKKGSSLDDEMPLEFDPTNQPQEQH